MKIGAWAPGSTLARELKRASSTLAANIPAATKEKLMRITKRNLFIPSQKARSLTPWFGGLALMGGVTFTLLALHDDARTEVSAVHPVPDPDPPSAQSRVTLDDDIRVVPAPAPEPVELEPTEIEATRPQLALEHEDEHTDFLAEADAAMNAGDLKLAFESLRKHLWGNDPTAVVLLRIGRIGRELGELALAEEALHDAGQLDPTVAEVHVELARIYLDTKDLEKARFAARQAIRLDGQSPTAWNVAGRAALASSEFQRAEQAFRRAVELDPSDPMLHNNLGLLYIMTKNGPSAVDSLETSAELYAESVPTYVLNNLGLAYELGDRMDEAQEAFERALMQDPSYSRARVNLRRIEARILAAEQAKSVSVADAQPL